MLISDRICLRDLKRCGFSRLSNITMLLLSWCSEFESDLLSTLVASFMDSSMFALTLGSTFRRVSKMLHFGQNQGALSISSLLYSSKVMHRHSMWYHLSHVSQLNHFCLSKFCPLLFSKFAAEFDLVDFLFFLLDLLADFLSKFNEFETSVSGLTSVLPHGHSFTVGSLVRLQSLVGSV